jgi:hypothetical protein
MIPRRPRPAKSRMRSGEIAGPLFPAKASLGTTLKERSGRGTWQAIELVEKSERARFPLEPSSIIAARSCPLGYALISFRHTCHPS